LAIYKKTFLITTQFILFIRIFVMKFNDVSKSKNHGASLLIIH